MRISFLHRGRIRDPLVGAGVFAGSGKLKSREVVVPPVRVRRDGFCARKVSVDEAKIGAVAVGRQLDLDGRRAGWNVGASVPAPGEDEAVGLVEFDELTSCGVAREDLAVVDAAGLRVEVGVDSLP